MSTCKTLAQTLGADIFTKALGVDKLRQFLSDLGLMITSLPSLRGSTQPTSTTQQTISRSKPTKGVVELVAQPTKGSQSITQLSNEQTNKQASRTRSMKQSNEGEHISVDQSKPIQPTIWTQSQGIKKAEMSQTARRPSDDWKLRLKGCVDSQTQRP